MRKLSRMEKISVGKCLGFQTETLNGNEYWNVKENGNGNVTNVDVGKRLGLLRYENCGKGLGDCLVRDGCERGGFEQLLVRISLQFFPDKSKWHFVPFPKNTFPIHITFSQSAHCLVSLKVVV